MSFIESGMAPGKDLCRERITNRWTHEQKSWVSGLGSLLKQLQCPRDSVYLL